MSREWRSIGCVTVDRRNVELQISRTSDLLDRIRVIMDGQIVFDFDLDFMDWVSKERRRNQGRRRYDPAHRGDPPEYDRDQMDRRK